MHTKNAGCPLRDLRRPKDRPSTANEGSKSKKKRHFAQKAPPTSNRTKMPSNYAKGAPSQAPRCTINPIARQPMPYPTERIVHKLIICTFLHHMLSPKCLIIRPYSTGETARFLLLFSPTGLARRMHKISQPGWNVGPIGFRRQIGIENNAHPVKNRPLVRSAA
ncbi:hypothetical protein SAMN04515647_4075 [Cohaesibacter sp. ES.047]|nr:hypothetical protein SAMN04515647_4075 [Cohaesibacter sp. ES.047]